MLTGHKVYHDGGGYITTAYVYDAKRKACVDSLFDRAAACGLADTELYGYIRSGFILRYGSGDYYLDQLDDVIARKLQKRTSRVPLPYDSVFDYYFLESVKTGLLGAAQADYIKAALTDNFGAFEGIDEYITDMIKRRLASFRGRRRRFQRKTFLNRWTHFVTVTFDDERDTPETFRQRLKKCFSNLHTRNGWKYMGVFEHGGKKNRLHFHALVNIPDGRMPGTVYKVRRFNFERRRMVDCLENSRFKAEFGINDFSPIENMDISWRNLANKTVNYILKYMVKNDERIFYSRAVPTFIEKNIDFYDDVSCPIRRELSDFVYQFCLFDDVFEDGGTYDADVHRGFS